MLIRLIVPGEFARVEDLNTSVEAVLNRHGIRQAVRDDVRLIIEELASNALDYGGVDSSQSPQHELSVNITIDGELLKLEFRDTGSPFDPLDAPDPDLEADIIDRPIGGLGVYLIRQMAQAISYERSGDYNILRISLRIPSTETEA